MVPKSALVAMLVNSKTLLALLIPTDISNVNIEQAQSVLMNPSEPAGVQNNRSLHKSAHNHAHTIDGSNANALGLNDIPYIKDILNFFNEHNDDCGDNENEVGPSTADSDDSGKHGAKSGGNEEEDDDDDCIIGSSFESNTESPVNNSTTVPNGSNVNKRSIGDINDGSVDLADIEDSNPTFNATFAAGIFIDKEDDEECEKKKKWFWPF